MTSTFDLFIRLMDDPYYKQNLFGDISATTQINRSGRPLKEILNRQDLHHRLVNGSDYPLPAINATVSTKNLQKQGFINSEEESYLDEVYNYNPLLFDFVVKRTIKAPDSKSKFSPSVFVKNRALEV